MTEPASAGAGTLEDTAVGVSLGVYEKALMGATLDELFASASRAGFSFVDLSLDETRLDRLDWTPQRRVAVRDSASRHGIAIGGLCLSAHRTIAPGSKDPLQRARALDVLVRAIDLACDLGVPVVQIAGYYAYHERPRESARADYVEVLRQGVRHAARVGVLLGLENVDGTDVTTIEVARSVVAEIGSPWLQLYPDVGNFVVQTQDVIQQLRAADGLVLALHVKDARPGEPRRVGMGEGCVPWAAAFAELARQQWSGRMMIEMWNDDSRDSEAIVTEARQFIEAKLRDANVRVLAPRRETQGARVHA